MTLCQSSCLLSLHESFVFFARFNWTIRAYYSNNSKFLRFFCTFIPLNLRFLLFHCKSWFSLIIHVHLRLMGSNLWTWSLKTGFFFKGYSKTKTRQLPIRISMALKPLKSLKQIEKIYQVKLLTFPSCHAIYVLILKSSQFLFVEPFVLLSWFEIYV